MTLEQICVTKEWAEKLKEAGYPQDDSFYKWCDYGEKSLVMPFLMSSEARSLRTSGHGGNIVPKFFSAPTASEILEKLPTMVEHRECNLFLGIWKRISGECAVRYKPNSGHVPLPVQFGRLPNALAKMYCYLVQENLTKKE